jgi:AraC-like DNA-binding protein
MHEMAVNFLHWDRFPHCTASVDKYFDGYYSIQLIDAGAVDLWYDQRHYRLAGGAFWPNYPGPKIHFRAAPRPGYWSHRYVAFRGPQVLTWRYQGLLTFVPQQVANAAGWVREFDELLALLKRTDRLGRLRAVNALEQLLLALADVRLPHTQVNWVDRVHQRMTDVGMFWPDYAKLAGLEEMGISTLRRKYRQAAGQPLHHAMLDRRMAAARELLMNTDLPLKEIAQALGYKDVFFFCRQFRRLIGMTPGAYRSVALRDNAP